MFLYKRFIYYNCILHYCIV